MSTQFLRAIPIGLEFIVELLKEHHRQQRYLVDDYENSALAKQTGLALSEWKNYRLQGCGRCHTCGNKLTPAKWCTNCGRRRLYVCHGHVALGADKTPCRPAVLGKHMRKHRLKRLGELGKPIYISACNGDTVATEKLRAIIKSRPKQKVLQPLEP